MLAVPPYFRSFPSALSNVRIAAQASDLTQARTIIPCFSTEGSHTETSARFRTGCFQPTASTLCSAFRCVLTYVHSPITVIIHEFPGFVKSGAIFFSKKFDLQSFVVFEGLNPLFLLPKRKNHVIMQAEPHFKVKGPQP